MRQHAELRLKLRLESSRCRSHERYPASLQATHREISVREIELEMQNDELRAAQIALKNTGQLYNRLYDQAPVGYISMDACGIIIQSNLTASALLGTLPEMLPGSRSRVSFFLMTRIFFTSCASACWTTTHRVRPYCA